MLRLPLCLRFRFDPSSELDDPDEFELSDELSWAEAAELITREIVRLYGTLENYLNSAGGEMY